MIINGLTINESEFILENGKVGKIAVFLYCGNYDPQVYLDMAVENYTKKKNDVQPHFIELISASLDNPWMRVVISSVNDMFQEVFDTNKHHIENSLHNKLVDIGI